MINVSTLLSLLPFCVAWIACGLASPLKVASLALAETPGLDSQKLSSPLVLEVIVKIVQRYDLIAVQDVYDLQAVRQLQLKVNNDTNVGRYEIAVSPRAAGGDRFVLFYRHASLAVVNSWQYPDPNGTFATAPFAIHVQPKSSDDIGVQNFICLVVRTSSDADKNFAALSQLPKVYDMLNAKWSVPDVLIMGNLNADCNSFRRENWLKLHLWTDRKKYQWLLTRSADTTTSPKTNCALDRFIAIGAAMRASVVVSSASVFRFDLAFGLTQFETLVVSSHYPIEVELHSVNSREEAPIIQAIGSPLLIFHTVPAGVTSSREATIWFEIDSMPSDINSKKNTLNYLCRLDNEVGTACTSPWRRSNLDDGNHVLLVMPISSQGQTYNAGSFAWRVDTRPPAVTTISYGFIKHDAPMFSFSCDEHNCLFECLLTNHASQYPRKFIPCSGGYLAAPLTSMAASLNFSVRAIDVAGNRGQPHSMAIPLSPIQNLTSVPPPVKSCKPDEGEMNSSMIVLTCICTAIGTSMVWVIILCMCRSESTEIGETLSDKEALHEGEGEKSIQASLPSCNGAASADVTVVRLPSPLCDRSLNSTKSPQVSSLSLSVLWPETVESPDGVRLDPPAQTNVPFIRENSPKTTAEDPTNATAEGPTNTTAEDPAVLSMVQNMNSQKAVVPVLRQTAGFSLVDKGSEKQFAKDKHTSAHLENDHGVHTEESTREKRRHHRRHQHLHHHRHRHRHHQDYRRANSEGVPSDDELKRHCRRHRSRNVNRPLPLSEKDEDLELASTSEQRSSKPARQPSDSTQLPNSSPSLIDPVHRRQLAKKMVHDRKAWLYYFSDAAQCSDGESLCLSLQSAPPAPNGFRVLDNNVDNFKPHQKKAHDKSDTSKLDTCSVLSGRTTCV